MPRARTTRREFVKQTSVAAAAAYIAPLVRANSGRGESIGVGVVGTGGRGTGACRDCLVSSDNVRLVAMGDLKYSICERARKTLANDQSVAGMVEVPDENIYEGVDAYRRVIGHPDVDVVILTTSPGFRPIHIAEAVAAGKHIFAEKPVCVDPAGYRSVLESGATARRNGTAIVTGTMYRRQPSYMEAVARVHDGMIGEVTSGVSYYCSTGIWYRGRKDGMSDLEYQLNNWYHFVWLCGDQIVEQAVHNLDVVNWVMGGPPVRAYGSGGQMTRPADSEIYDHMSIDYAYPGGSDDPGHAINVSFKCRQIPGSSSKVINTFVGRDGVAYINPGSSSISSHDGEVLFHHRGGGNNPYVQEHADMIASIRAGNPIVEVEETANSSLTAVLGRLAAYSGKDVSFEFAQQSAINLMPDNLGPDTRVTSPGVVIPGTYALS